MIDMRGHLEVFMTTNGRSTFEYAKRSVDEQVGVEFDVTIIKDLPWLEANRKMLKLCKSRFFLRVDDDMILHPLAMLFINHVSETLGKKIVLRGWRLWEPYSSKVCKGIKIHHTGLTRKIGFDINNLGKIDKVFTAKARKKGLKLIYSTDVIAIHSCSTFNEHLEYSIMRGEEKGVGFAKEKKWMKNHIDACPLSLEEQYDLRGRFLEKLNKKRKADFFRFVRQHSE